VNVVFLHPSRCGGEGMKCGGSALRRYGGPHGGGTGATPNRSKIMTVRCLTYLDVGQLLLSKVS
jgi:hypothetical protein